MTSPQGRDRITEEDVLAAIAEARKNEAYSDHLLYGWGPCPFGPSPCKCPAACPEETPR
jgi:hypothetical protein